MIKIIALREGFRRAGIAHSTAPTLHQDDAFTPEELAALQGDPMLIVEVIKRGPGRPPKPKGSDDEEEGQAKTEAIET